MHEAKGVVSATTGNILSASGGVGAWVAPYTLQTVKESVVFTGSHTSDQLPASNDVAQNVLFGGASAGTDISIDASGNITANTAGYYRFKFNFNLGRTSAAGSSIIFLRLVINGTPTGFVQGIQLDSQSSTVPFQADFDTVLTAGSTVKVEMYRSSAGIANGGLKVIAGTLGGWASTPSAWLRIYKDLGVGN